MRQPAQCRHGQAGEHHDGAGAIRYLSALIGLRLENTHGRSREPEFDPNHMALSEIEVARVKRGLDSFMRIRRPPPHIREQLDLGYRISGQSVEIFEIRPAWRGLPGERHESPIAKATFVRSRNVWRVFWQRRDLKWHSYDPASEVKSIDDFLSLVAEDHHACFFG